MKLAAVVALSGVTIIGVTAMPDNAQCTLVPGIGAGCFTVNATKRAQLDPKTEKDYLEKGIRFFFGDDDTLAAIVSEKTCKTDKGISVGDSEDRVKELYGKPKIIQTPLSKGSVTVGTVGEKTLAYSGVHFIIAKGKVLAIVILPK
jgi:hypothetical protein